MYGFFLQNDLQICYFLFKLINNYDCNNFSEFKKGLKGFLDSVENDHEILIIKRKSGKGVVLISLDEYNSIMETMHLLSSKKNADRLHESIQQMKEHL